MKTVLLPVSVPDSMDYGQVSDIFSDALSYYADDMKECAAQSYDEEEAKPYKESLEKAEQVGVVYGELLEDTVPEVCSTCGLEADMERTLGYCPGCSTLKVACKACHHWEFQHTHVCPDCKYGSQFKAACEKHASIEPYKDKTPAGTRWHVEPPLELPDDVKVKAQAFISKYENDEWPCDHWDLIQADDGSEWDLNCYVDADEKGEINKACVYGCVGGKTLTDKWVVIYNERND